MSVKRRNSTNPRPEVHVNIKFSSGANLSGSFSNPKELFNRIVEFGSELNESHINLPPNKIENSKKNIKRKKN